MKNTSTLHDILDDNIKKAIDIKNNGNYNKSIELLLKTLHEIKNNNKLNINSNEHLAEIYFELFSNYCNLENYEKAKDYLNLFQNIESKIEKSPSIKYSIANYYHSIDKNDVAIDILLDALNCIIENSDDHDPSIYHHLLFKIYLEDKIIDKARYHINQAKIYDSEYTTDVYGKIWEAKLLKQEGNIQEAISIFELCIHDSELGAQYKENIYEAYCDLIECCMNIDDIDKAEKFINEYFNSYKSLKDNYRLKYLQAKTLKRKNNYEDSKRYFIEIIESDTPDIYISCSMYELAEMYIDNKLHDEAIKYLQKGITDKKLNSKWLASFNCELGRAYNGLGEYESARKYFLKALKYNHRNYNNRLWLAHILIMQQKYIFALYHLIRLINKYDNEIDKKRLANYFKITVVRIFPIIQLLRRNDSPNN